MLRPATYIRYHITAILAVHWVQFVAQYKRWIRPVVFENVRKVLACRTPVVGCHIYHNIGRYTKRAVMAEYRIVYYDGKIVRFSYKDYAL